MITKTELLNAINRIQKKNRMHDDEKFYNALDFAAMVEHDCDTMPSEYIKLLADNKDLLDRLIEITDGYDIGDIFANQGCYDDELLSIFPAGGSVYNDEGSLKM